MLTCSSPRLFAAYRVLHRQSVPWHPPCALLRLILPVPRRSRAASAQYGFLRLLRTVSRLVRGLSSQFRSPLPAPPSLRLAASLRLFLPLPAPRSDFRMLIVFLCSFQGAFLRISLSRFRGSANPQNDTELRSQPFRLSPIGLAFRLSPFSLALSAFRASSQYINRSYGFSPCLRSLSVPPTSSIRLPPRLSSFSQASTLGFGLRFRFLRLSLERR